MLRKRHLQVKMVRDGDDATDVVEEVGSFEIKAEVVADQVKSVLLFVGTGVIAYVIADTFRQIAVERARK